MGPNDGDDDDKRGGRSSRGDDPPRADDAGDSDAEHSGYSDTGYTGYSGSSGRSGGVPGKRTRVERRYGSQPPRPRTKPAATPDGAGSDDKAAPETGPDGKPLIMEVGADVRSDMEGLALVPISARTGSRKQTASGLNAHLIVECWRGGKLLQRWVGMMTSYSEVAEHFRADVVRGVLQWHAPVPDPKTPFKVNTDKAGAKGELVETWMHKDTTRIVVQVVPFAPPPPGPQPVELSDEMLYTPLGGLRNDDPFAEGVEKRDNPGLAEGGIALSGTSESGGTGERPAVARRFSSDFVLPGAPSQALARGTGEGAAVHEEQDSADVAAHPSGLGASGRGPGAVAGASGAAPGLGSGAGIHEGDARGSEDPSWAHSTLADSTLAEVDPDGGRTPGDGGKVGGSAAGVFGESGHLLGPGWFGVIDAPEDVAPAINAALIITEADVTGVTQKVFRKALRGMAEDALRAELRREAMRVADGRMDEVRRVLAEVPEANRAALEAQARELIEREFYDQVRARMAKLADESEEAAARYVRDIESGRSAGESVDVAEHGAKVARENAAAYRRLEQAAAHNGGLADDAGHAATVEGRGRADVLDGEDMAAMHRTNARGAGAVAEEGAELLDGHHVLPQEHKAWFQERGFPGDDIDNFCIELPVVEHQALHGGGNWKLARKVWPEGEWNTALMNELRRREHRIGHKLTRDDILEIVKQRMTQLEIDHLPFVPFRRKAK